MLKIRHISLGFSEHFDNVPYYPSPYKLMLPGTEKGVNKAMVKKVSQGKGRWEELKRLCLKKARFIRLGEV